jgi:hypothetical protein
MVMRIHPSSASVSVSAAAPFTCIFRRRVRVRPGFVCRLCFVSFIKKRACASRPYLLYYTPRLISLLLSQ